MGPRKSVHSAQALRLTDYLGKDRWWLVAESTVRKVDTVGVAAVGIENLGFQDAVEDLPGEEVVSGPAVEAFDVGVGASQLPRTRWRGITPSRLSSS